MKLFLLILLLSAGKMFIKELKEQSYSQKCWQLLTVVAEVLCQSSLPVVGVCGANSLESLENSFAYHDNVKHCRIWQFWVFGSLQHYRTRLQSEWWKWSKLIFCDILWPIRMFMRFLIMQVNVKVELLTTRTNTTTSGRQAFKTSTRQRVFSDFRKSWKSISESPGQCAEFLYWFSRPFNGIFPNPTGFGVQEPHHNGVRQRSIIKQIHQMMHKTTCVYCVWKSQIDVENRLKKSTCVYSVYYIQIYI